MTTSAPIDWDVLFDAALRCREQAYCPYSSFPVGAALLTEEGEVVVGCNVENRSYGMTICAERTAVTSAVARGRRRFRAIAIVAETSPPPRPCGLCLDSLAEFNPELEVLLANPGGEREILSLADLLPQPFRF